ncbi:PH domain-containing protein [Tessaracoccus sp. OS52]|uniref:PH domain-containing protein n=1 Tax=Tessaracoccus sp. OS52 TaxID=2886691 RepID=UPI001D11EE9C|nr:PH domain-containing protein [Tessaracoccus sp. OS52]MCC2594244.1 PH domain-containing protein [Tessaracoccus sp. OS52]
MTSMDELFRPPGAQWQPLSPNYLKMKMILILTVWPILIAIVVTPVAFLLPGPSWWILLVVLGLVWLWRILRQPKAVRRWGYAETDTDVYITHGLAWRQLTGVPYGRMQLVNVQSGPLERAFDLASVEMVTSSTSGTITIPGLSRDDAAALRDRLMERGELLQAGI